MSFVLLFSTSIGLTLQNLVCYDLLLQSCQKGHNDRMVDKLYILFSQDVVMKKISLVSMTRKHTKMLLSKSFKYHHIRFAKLDPHVKCHTCPLKFSDVIYASLSGKHFGQY